SAASRARPLAHAQAASVRASLALRSRTDAALRTIVPTTSPADRPKVYAHGLPQAEEQAGCSRLSSRRKRAHAHTREAASWRFFRDLVAVFPPNHLGSCLLIPAPVSTLTAPPWRSLASSSLAPTISLSDCEQSCRVPLICHDNSPPAASASIAGNGMGRSARAK